jgi:cytochrome b6-f complex iron-sulfur subunit
LAIALVLAGLVALVVVTAIAAFPTGPKVDQLTGAHWVTVARADDLQVDQPLHIFEQRLWLVKLNTGDILALSQKSTHLGCTVPYRPDFVWGGIKSWFRDPCSGSTWDLNGHKVYGPAPRGLDQHAVQIVGAQVQVLVGPNSLIENAVVEAKAYRPLR